MRKIPLPLRWIAIIPVSLLSTISVYYVFKLFISVLALFVPTSSYGDVITLVAIGLSAHTCIISAALMAPKYKKRISGILMTISVLAIAWRSHELIIAHHFIFLYQVQALAILTGTISAFVKVMKEDNLSFDSLFVG